MTEAATPPAEIHDIGEHEWKRLVRLVCGEAIKD